MHTAAGGQPCYTHLSFATASLPPPAAMLQMLNVPCKQLPGSSCPDAQAALDRVRGQLTDVAWGSSAPLSFHPNTHLSQCPLTQARKV